MLRLSLFITTILILFNSEAQGLRCFDIFAKHELTATKKSAFFYAEALDHLNTKYNNFLFNDSLLDVLSPTKSEASFKIRTQARYRAFKLRRILKSIYQHDQFLNANDDLKAHAYAVEKVASKLERLTFLNDESVTITMSFADKVAYRQAQHSLLAQGLARFLFHDEKVLSPSQTKKILQTIMIPFKDIYLRWSYALAYMPKLTGAVIPYSIVEKVAIDGYENNKTLLAPYINSTRGKYAFNTFSTAYNWIIAGTMTVAAGQLIGDMHEVYTQGQVAALKLLSPSFENSKKIANTDYAAIRKQKNLELILAEFKIQYEREPLTAELAMIKELIEQNQDN